MPGTGQDIAQDRIENIDQSVRLSEDRSLLTTFNMRLYAVIEGLIHHYSNSDIKSPKDFFELSQKYQILLDFINELLLDNKESKNYALKDLFENQKDEILSTIDFLYTNEYDKFKAAEKSISLKPSESSIKSLKNEIFDKMINTSIEKKIANSEFNFDPPAELMKKVNNQLELRRVVLQGVGSKMINPINMADDKGRQKDFNNPFASLYGEITGAGESQNIAYCMNLLDKAMPKPDRILLVGHSRGACSQIELARKIYLKYGDSIKVAMNLNDPVPGPFRFSESKCVIPPNVDSLTILYAANEKGVLLQPIDIKKLHFDPSVTTVTAIPYKSEHNDSLNVLHEINNAIYMALLTPAAPVPAISLNDMISKEVHGSKNRSKCELACASDPSENKLLPLGLIRLHNVLQKELSFRDDKVKKNFHDKCVYNTIQRQADTEMDRKNVLRSIYRENHKPLNNLEAHFTRFLNAEKKEQKNIAAAEKITPQKPQK